MAEVMEMAVQGRAVFFFGPRFGGPIQEELRLDVSPNAASLLCVMSVVEHRRRCGWVWLGMLPLCV